MISATLLSLALVAQADLGPGRTSTTTRIVSTETIVCDDCGVRASAVASAIRCLATSPRDESREDSARALRSVKWACHPEVLTALSDALLHDPDWCVREEAAESLTRLGACDPEVHEALARAAVRDPKLCVRLRARKGLKALARRCDGDCSICDGSPVPGPIMGPVRMLGPVRSLMPSIGINVPGLRMQIGPRRPPIGIGPPVVLGPPVVVEPGPIVPTPTDPDLRPLRPEPEADEIPPPRPEPSPFVAPRPDPIPMPEALPSRRSSSKPVSPTPSRPVAPSPKPVTPETDLPPLVGPSAG